MAYGYTRNFCESKRKPGQIKAFTGLEPLTSAKGNRKDSTNNEEKLRKCFLIEIVVSRRDRFGSETMKYDFNKSMIELNRFFFPLQRDSKKAYSPNEGLAVERNISKHLYGDHITVSLVFLILFYCF